MNRSDMEGKSTYGAVNSHSANTRLSGSWLLIARIVWLALVIPSLGLFVVSLPVYYQLLQTTCVDVTKCNLYAALPGSGYATLVDTILFVVFPTIWCGIGLLIFLRRSDDWLALLGAFVLVLYDITFPGIPTNALAFASPALVLPLNLMIFLGQVSLGVFFLFFPNGRLVPRWMVLILPLIIMDGFLGVFPSPTSPFNTGNWPIWLDLLVTLALYGSIIASQIYRYRRVSTRVQRQQTKWVIFGVAAVVGVVIGLFAIGLLVPTIVDIHLYTELWSIILPVTLLLIPLSIGFSILRYRLYDIDVLINRTLVYGTLTVLLALVYVGLIFSLQYLLRGMISQNNDVAIVVSTLAIAALFQPLRHRIQAIIDRRFYRRKYDAAKIVETFSATLRNEVDLNQLREHLITVVQDTMQPSHISLWLREPASKPSRPDRMQP